MDSLPNLINSVLEESFDTKAILEFIIMKKFHELEIELEQEQIDKIVNHLEQYQDESFNIDIKDKQYSGSRVVLEEGIGEEITINFNETDFEEAVNEFSSLVEEQIPKIINELSVILQEHIERNIHLHVNEIIKERKAFEKRLLKRWKDPFDLLEMFNSLVIEAGFDFHNQYNEDAAKANDLLFDVLNSLHERACQISSEILILLKAGFADGAHARWRTLHEIVVVAIFIAKHGNESAKKYLQHEAVVSYKAANQYQEYCESLGYEPLSEEEMTKIREKYENASDKTFKEDYGWAASEIGKDKPNFSDIEKAVELDKNRPYYKLASHNVHANPKWIMFKLGMLPSETHILLAGPTNSGFTDPAHGTAISLLQITTTLLMTKPNMDSLVLCNVLIGLVDKIGDQFLAVQNKLKQEHMNSREG